MRQPLSSQMRFQNSEGHEDTINSGGGHSADQSSKCTEPAAALAVAEQISADDTMEMKN